MSAVQALNVRARGLCPFVNHRGVASAAAGLVHELPREDSARGLVARDDEFDPFAVGGL